MSNPFENPPTPSPEEKSRKIEQKPIAEIPGKQFFPEEERKRYTDLMIRDFSFSEKLSADEKVELERLREASHARYYKEELPEWESLESKLREVKEGRLPFLFTVDENKEYIEYVGWYREETSREIFVEAVTYETFFPEDPKKQKVKKISVTSPGKQLPFQTETEIINPPAENTVDPYMKFEKKYFGRVDDNFTEKQVGQLTGAIRNREEELEENIQEARDFLAKHVKPNK